MTACFLFLGVKKALEFARVRGEKKRETKGIRRIRYKTTVYIGGTIST